MLKVVFATVVLSIFSQSSFAETLKSKTEEVSNDTVRGVKRATRKVKDETCEMINGKMKCAAQKMEHSIKNTSDKVEDAID